MLRIITGRAGNLSGALLNSVSAALSKGGCVHVVVPKQLTLQTELILIRALAPSGSFDINVISPERLCARIFASAGRPALTRVDDRGRVMLARCAIRNVSGNLRVYSGAQHRRGFSVRAARQLEIFRQAGLSADDVLELADGETGIMEHKTRDLGRILQAYEELLEGKFQDGEAEFIAAAEKCAASDIADCAGMVFYGFDIMPMPLYELMAALAARAQVDAIFFCDNSSADSHIFSAVNDSLARLAHKAKTAGVETERISVPAARGEGDIARVETGLFAAAKNDETNIPIARGENETARTEFGSCSAAQYDDREIASARGEGGAARIKADSFNDGYNQNDEFNVNISYGNVAVSDNIDDIYHNNPVIRGEVAIAAINDINSEAAYIAARAREMAARGVRWREMAVLCADMNSYSQPLADAFSDFEIPIFMTSSRASSRHALSEALLSALRLISRGFRAEDAQALLRTGFAGVTGRDADLLGNYLTRYRPRGRALAREFTRGEDAPEIEPLRAQLLSPVLLLRDQLRAARDTAGRLRAIFEYLCNIGAYETVLARSKALAERGLHSAAGEETQVWNRVISTLDQAAAFITGARLSLRELEETLADSLDAALIKPLPQSGDAVCAQSAETLLAQPVKCVFFAGFSDRQRLGTDALFTARQLSRLAAKARRYLGPDDSEAARMRFYYIKCALGMARDSAIFTYSLAGADGSAQSPATILTDIKRLLNISEENPDDVARLLTSSPRAALRRNARALIHSGVNMPELEKLQIALDSRRASESMRPETAHEIYSALEKASVTRLETFARCPFAHYVSYAIKPERVEPYELTALDEGSFFHEAVRAFVSENMNKLGEMNPESAEKYMDGVCDTLLEDMEAGALGASAVARAQKKRLKNAARAAARAIIKQMEGSDFRTVEVEMGFGGQDARALSLSVDGKPCALEGRVDRVDEWDGGETDYLRVIDYKRGGTELRLGAAYLGLQLQLTLYLAAAMKRRGAQGAGVYYFRVDEGIIVTQETDPAQIERRRTENARLRGLSINDIAVLSAMSPAPDEVITVKLNKDGSVSKNSAATDARGIRKLIDIALERASEDVSELRAGKAAPSPVRTAKLDACAYCENRRACLFDEVSDAARVRRMSEMSNAEVLEKLRAADDE